MRLPNSEHEAHAWRIAEVVPDFRLEELSNRTVHAVMHLAWVDRGAGLYRGQMGVYVKPRGSFGSAYMAAIAPFRHRVVYPALMREIERAWNARSTHSRRTCAANPSNG
jgi:hypothetical protein